MTHQEHKLDEGIVKDAATAQVDGPGAAAPSSPLQAELERLFRRSLAEYRNLRWAGFYVMGGLTASGVIGLWRGIARADSSLMAYAGWQIAFGLLSALIYYLLISHRFQTVLRRNPDLMMEVSQALQDTNLFAEVLNEIDGTGPEAQRGAANWLLSFHQLTMRSGSKAKGLVTSLQQRGIRILESRYKTQSMDFISQQIMVASLRLALAKVLIDELGDNRGPER